MCRRFSSSVTSQFVHYFQLKHLTTYSLGEGGLSICDLNYEFVSLLYTMGYFICQSHFQTTKGESRIAWHPKRAQVWCHQESQHQETPKWGWPCHSTAHWKNSAPQHVAYLGQVQVTLMAPPTDWETDPQAHWCYFPWGSPTLLSPGQAGLHQEERIERFELAATLPTYGR